MIQSIRSPKITNTAGFTVLEVMVAMFIFGFFAMALLKALAATDRIHSRAVTITNATTLAENEIEYLRKKAAFNEEITDCTYVETVDRREYQIERKVLIPDSLLFKKDESTLIEVEVTVSQPAQSQTSPFKFRLLQGTSW